MPRNCLFDFWAVAYPDGGYIPCTVRDTRTDAISAAEDYAVDPWSVMWRRGYRCVKVTIEEGWPDA